MAGELKSRQFLKIGLSSTPLFLNPSLPQPFPSSTPGFLNPHLLNTYLPQLLPSSTNGFLCIYIYIYMYIYIIASCFWHGPFPPMDISGTHLMDILRWGTDISSDIHPPQPTPPHITPRSTGGCPPTRGWWGVPPHTRGGAPLHAGGCPLQF